MGQSGVNKRLYFKNLINLLAQRGYPDVHLKSVFEYMKKEDPEIIEDKALDLTLGELRCKRRLALRSILSEINSTDDVVILDTHAVFRYKWGLFTAFDIDQILEFKPDLIITLIDDIHSIQGRIDQKKGEFWGDHNLFDILMWREEEIFTTDMIAKIVGTMNPDHKPVPHFVLARTHSPDVIIDLIFHPNKKKVYLSFPRFRLNCCNKSTGRKISKIS